MTDVTGQKAPPPPPAEPRIGRGAWSWTDKAPRGLALAVLSLLGGTVAVVALREPQPATPHYRAVDAAPMPEAIAQSELPPLFLLGEKKTAELVNYRVAGRYLIVDRLFAVAELRLGTRKPQIVRITRNASQEPNS